MQPSRDELQACVEAALAAAAPTARAPAPSVLLPFLLGSLATCAALLLAAGAVALTWRARRQRRQQLQAAAQLADADEAQLQRLLGEALPAWWARCHCVLLVWPRHDASSCCCAPMVPPPLQSTPFAPAPTQGGLPRQRARGLDERPDRGAVAARGARRQQAAAQGHLMGETRLASGTRLCCTLHR